ncbi:MAG: NAD(P)H-hydrate dehydratase [Alphaproteobacteria bacterium]|nr:NAD(P)H-hydrate dehydratase [Alphaproteobacteria bacterium]
MFEVLTAAQMKKADLETIAGGVAAQELIGNAGSGMARVIQDNYPLSRTLVLCGPGNNGADGFIAAARLKAAGWPVRVACLVKTNALKGDAAASAKKWDGEVEALNSNLKVHDTELVVDAIFGTGFDRALDPEIVTLLDKIRARKIPVVAADIPSGLNATTGQVAAGTLKADMTVAFCRKKIAHVLLPGRQVCGRLQLTAVGIPDEVVAAQGSTVFENHPALWLRDFPLPKAESHKFSRGHALVYGGDIRTGAACLAAAAAQRAGAGMVSILSRPAGLDVYRSYRASIMTESFEDIEEFRAALRDERRTALLIGPGAGLEDSLKETVEAALSFNKFTVLDADVFTAFKDDAKSLFAKLSPDRNVLTPHEGEFTRIFGEMSGNKLERAQKAAKTANAVVLLKGADTVIAAPDGTAVVNTNAPATLATAGSGDVLAGIITGLAAQGMPVFMATCAAAWLHAEAARNFGLGLVAEDLVNQLPNALNHLFRLS